MMPAMAVRVALHPETRRSNASYWNGVVQTARRSGFQRLWRRHSDAINGELLRRWLPAKPVDALLKTDLFDEAVAEGVYPVLFSRARRIVGIDVAESIAAAAGERYPSLEAVVADVTALPFASECFDVVVSISTLDHFDRFDAVEAALAEIHRTLKPGGQLILTMDNRANPVVALRNALPYGMLHRVGLVPYYVGVTCGPRRLRAAATRAGLAPVEMESILHVPRAMGVGLARAVERRGNPGAEARFLRTAGRCEPLRRLPTRYLTGYYIAVLAVKPRAGDA